MANDVNANIRVNLDTSQALAGLQSLQSRISSFNQSVIQSNAQAVAAQRNLLNNFQAQIGASRQFSTSITNVETSVGRLQTAIDKNRLSMGQYFRYGVASSKNFGKVFRQENEAITRLATERVQKLQTQYVALGQAQGGMTKALAVRPLQMFNADSAIAIQKSQIFNKLLQDGSTSLVNWGKNTQWAGRQLMVGFTVPLTIFGGMAAKTFMELEEQAISFRKVYGDIFTTEAEVEENLAAVRELTQEMTKYGIAASETFELANVAAQSGARGADLMAQTRQATRLAVLGQMEQQEAVKTTITLQNAFQLSNEDLADSINFLNIVENQSVLSLQDVAGAIPRVAPVVKSLGGDVRDLSVMLVAMREGGVSAAEGANALKTSLARLISPTAGASKMAKELGINLNGIVEANQGDILGAVMQLAGAMEELDELSQQRLLSEIFGKRQYARVGALFNNITNEASQAQRVLDLTTMSTEDLAATAEKELGAVEQSISTKFTAAVELLKTEIAPIGEQFLKLATPIVDAVGKIFAKFNDLSPTVKNFVTVLAAGVGVVVPVVLMLVGLFGNLLGNLVKGFATLSQFFQRIRNGSESVEYLAGNQLEAAAAAASLEGQVTGLTGSLNIQREAIDALTQAYGRYIAGANTAAASLPQGFRTPSAPAVAPTGMAMGGMVGGVGNKDTEPALLTPGEFVINADASKRFAPLLAAINEGRVGKYARGRTEGNISFGSLGGVNIPAGYSQASIDSIQAMADDLANAGDDVRLAFKQILEDLSQTQGLTKAMVTEAESVRGSQFPEISGMGGERKYSASKAGERRSIETQLREDLAERANNEELIRQEYARAQAAADGAVRSINEYYDDLVKNANSQEEINDINKKRTKQVEEASRIDRAHIVELTNAQKLERESWNARLWMPQSGIENQLSNMLARSENNQAIFEQYLMDLADTSVSEDQRLQILEKVRGNIALTDSELDIQAKVLRRIVEDAERNAILVQRANGEFAKISPQFVPYAQGTIGAAEARAAMGPLDPSVQASRIAMSQEFMGGMRSDLGIASPSEEAAKIADSVPEGVAVGIKRSTPQATAAARELAQEVEGQLMMEFEDDDALFPAAPYKGERRLQPTTPTQGRQRDPLPVAPKSVQDDLIRATQRASTGLNNAGSQASQTAKRFAGLRGGIAKFGGALRGGSMKMQGAFFALDGLVFAASMMNNSLGEVAQKALPVVFGLQGLTMVLPLLEKMLFKMIAVLGGVGTGLVALVAAAAIGMKLWSDRINAARQKTADYVVALDGSIQSLRAFSEKFGTALPTERIRQRLQGITGEEEQERVTEAQTFLREGGGQAIIERVSGLSMEERFNALRMELLQGIAFEIMTPEQARDIAKAIGLELSSPALGNRLVMSIRDAISQDSGSLESAFVGIIEESVERSKSFAEEFAKTIEENRVAITSADVTFGPDVALTDEQAEQQADIDLSNVVGPGYEEALEDVGIKTEEATKKTEELTTVIIKMDDVLRFVGPAINNLGRLAQAQDTLNLKFREGLIDLEEFRRLSGQVEEGRESLAGAFESLLQAEGGVQQFNDAFDKTLTALGRTQEEIDAINNQAAAAADSVAALVEGADADVIEMGLKVGLADESITPEEVAAFYAGLAEDPDLAIKAQVILEDAAPEDIPRLMQIINEMSNLPEEVQTRIMTEFETDPPDFTKINEILLASTRFSEFPNLQEKAINIAINGGQQAQENLSRMEEYLTSISSNSEIAATFDFDAVDLVDLKQASDNWDSLGKKKNISKIIKANDQYSSVLDDFKVSYKELDSMPDIVKQAILLKLDILADIEIKLANVDPNDIPSMAGYIAQRDALKAQLEGLFDIGLDTTGGDIVEEEDTSGGGSAEESFLEGLINTFSANTKLFNTAEGAGKKYIAARGKFFGMLEQLRKEGIPEGIIAMIGTGAKGVENARELLNATAKERRELLRLYGSVVAGEAADEIRVQTSEAIIERDALRNIQGGGLSQNLQDFIMANEKLTLAFAGVKKGSKEYKELVRLAEELLGIEKERDELAKSTSDKLKEQYDNLDRSRQIILDSIDLEMAKNRNALYEEFAQNMGTTPEMLEHTIKMREHEIKQLERQVDRYDEIIAAEQERIEGIQSQIDGKEREISLIERQNELDERQIETLNRQDELRNRVADALSRELQQMSDMEGKIRDAYQDRIDALDKVAQVNDYIIGQQRQQLDLSKAISEGDIYAATAAVQEMRATSAGFARTQVRAGLEAGMENQIAGLRTSGGLTREQAEAQIENIQEQSYQTSLRIRDIEDRIYSRNQQIIPLKDEIYRLNEDIYVIEQEIVRQEGLKKTLLEQQIEPLQWANTAQQRLLEDLEKEVDEQNGPLAARQAHMKRHFDIATMQQNLNHSLWLQTEAIANGTLKAANRAGVLAANYGEAARNALAAAAAIASIAGGASVNAYAGGMIEELGMGGKVKKYRGGGVVSGMQALAYGGPVYGSGGRDTVPAMLMPGEFVVRKAMVEKYGEGLMKDINMGSFAMPSYEMETEMGTPVVQSNNMVSNINAPVYNSYDMKFAINGANQSADEIANTVMFKMRQLQNQGIRTNRGY